MEKNKGLKKRKYKKMGKKNLKNVEDYFDSLSLNLLSHGINIEYSLDFAERMKTYIHVHIQNKDLQKSSNFFSLFPYESRDLSYIIITKPGFGKYRISQEFKIGSYFNNKSYWEENPNLEGEEWLIKSYRDKRLILYTEEAIDLSQKLAKRLIGKEIYEVDERKVGPRRVVHYPSPSLAHTFLMNEGQESYSGSEIELEEEIVKKLEDSTLLENLIKFHEFFDELNSKE